LGTVIKGIYLLLQIGGVIERLPVGVAREQGQVAARVLQRQIERVVIGITHVLEPRIGTDRVWESRQIARAVHDGAIRPRIDQILAEGATRWTARRYVLWLTEAEA